MIKSMFLCFQRKHGLKVVNLTSTQSFPPFGEVVLCFSNQHFRGKEVVISAF